MLVSEIDFSRVPQKTLKNFFKSENLMDVDDLVPLCYLETKEPYSRHSKEYTVKGNIDTIWKSYVYQHPTKCWDSNMISFGMMYSREKGSMLYRTDSFDSLQTGQLYFISLKILGALFQIPVIHEIDEVDHDKKVIKSCYLASGKSEGSQWIRLFKIDEETTKIIHETNYKCESTLREKYLYPYFHTKAINEFHDNVRKVVEMV